MNTSRISKPIYLTFLFSLLIVASSALAKKPAEVMMLGSFHFSNPGLDAVKSQVIDVTTEQNQQYLVQLSKSIAEGFSPTHVLVECDPKFQEKFDKRYQQFLNGGYTLPVNETYQLGFRVAKFAGAKAVICFDERNVEWKAGPLMELMPKDAPQIQSELNEFLSQLTQDRSDMHANKSLKDILAVSNRADKAQSNKSLYLLTNSVGAGDSFVGADAAASWWHRNFRMYANIQQVAKPDTRVLVIAGFGHTAILQDFVSYDSKITGKDVGVFF